MTERELLQTMIDSTHDLLKSTVSDIPSDMTGKRPGPHMNPANFIYFHVLRHWDRDVNVLSIGQALDADAWHRHGIGDQLDYHPVGTGLRGLGTGMGYNDAEVDAVPDNLEVLKRYQDILYEETMAYLDLLDESQMQAEITSEYLPDVTYTASARLQHLITHSSYHTGDISFVKGALGQHDASYPG